MKKVLLLFTMVCAAGQLYGMEPASIVKSVKKNGLIVALKSDGMIECSYSSPSGEVKTGSIPLQGVNPHNVTSLSLADIWEGTWLKIETPTSSERYWITPGVDKASAPKQTITFKSSNPKVVVHEPAPKPKPEPVPFVFIPAQKNIVLESNKVVDPTTKHEFIAYQYDNGDIEVLDKTAEREVGTSKQYYARREGEGQKSGEVISLKLSTQKSENNKIEVNLIIEYFMNSRTTNTDIDRWKYFYQV